MSFIKRRTVALHGDPPATGQLSVMLEPKLGHDIEKVRSAALKFGAREVEPLAGGFMSAIVDSAVVPKLREIAHVHVKARKVLHSP